MKTPYTKPLLGVENFSLMQTAARDCSDSIPKENLTSGDIHNCSWEISEGLHVYIIGAACNMDGEQMEIGCYNNPSEGNYIFRS